MRAWLAVLFAGAFVFGAGEGHGQNYRCPPTPPDADGPFYRPDAPVRSRVGSGYGLTGEVRSALDCSKIGNAKIEIWLAGPDGIYGDAWRATVFSRSNGRYYFSSHLPGPYGSRPPHIHLIVNAPGYQELITQHYLTPGTTGSVFNLVLIPID
jgi:protocatechuate 3,4-dioxygenase beta subunit